MRRSWLKTGDFYSDVNRINSRLKRTNLQMITDWELNGTNHVCFVFFVQSPPDCINVFFSLVTPFSNIRIIFLMNFRGSRFLRG